MAQLLWINRSVASITELLILNSNLLSLFLLKSWKLNKQKNVFEEFLFLYFVECYFICFIVLQIAKKNCAWRFVKKCVQFLQINERVCIQITRLFVYLLLRSNKKDDVIKRAQRSDLYPPHYKCSNYVFLVMKYINIGIIIRNFESCSAGCIWATRNKTHPRSFQAS